MANFNTTTNYWSINGVSLQTYAWNISSWGDKEVLPPTRGGNLLVPYQTGQTWVSKIPDQRTITLSMWVTGANADGSVPRGHARAQFESNYASLRQLFYAVRQQLVLSKLVTYPDGTTQTVSARAEYVGGLQPSMMGTTAASFQVDLLLADPFFYGPWVQQKLGASTGVLVQGDDRTEQISVTCTGPRNTLRITNSSAPTSVWFQYNYNLGSGETITADVHSFDLIHTNAGAGSGYPAAGRVTHAGSDPYWLYLTPGLNTITTSSTSGTGPVYLNWQPRFI